MEQYWTCPTCSKTISEDDTVVLVRDRVFHFYCRRPQVLSPEEGALLFYYCWKHPIAKCGKCAREYRQSELAADLFSGREQLCPQCNAELLDNVRSHLYSCSMLPAEVRRRAQAARETARTLVKRGRELSDRADVLMREAECALDALRKTVRALPRCRVSSQPPSPPSP